MRIPRPVRATGNAACRGAGDRVTFRSMPIEMRPLSSHGLESAAKLLADGYADYFVPIPVSASALLQMARHDCVDLDSSRVLIDDGDPVGVALIARRGWTSRLAGMSIIPAGRGRGVGQAAVRELLRAARSRGERTMTLEVIQTNAPAVAAYEKTGFRRVRALVGFDLPVAPVGCEPEPAVEVDFRELARVIASEGTPDLPWQISAETIATLGPPHRAYRVRDAWIGLTFPATGPIAIRSLIVSRASRGRGQARAALEAAFARHPGQSWRAVAVCPEEYAGIFPRLGFTPAALSQWQMVADLGGG